jgi:hypothetical protein
MKAAKNTTTKMISGALKSKHKTAKDEEINDAGIKYRLKPLRKLTKLFLVTNKKLYKKNSARYKIPSANKIRNKLTAHIFPNKSFRKQLIPQCTCKSFCLLLLPRPTNHRI